MMSLYVNNFLLISKFCNLIDLIIQNFKSKYNIKNLKEVKMIIDQQITYNFNVEILKINQLAFIQNFLKEENLINCNFVNIPIKA